MFSIAVVGLQLLFCLSGCQTAKKIAAPNADFSTNKAPGQTPNTAGEFPVQLTGFEGAVPSELPQSNSAQLTTKDYQEAIAFQQDNQGEFDFDATVVIPRSVRDGILPTQRWDLSLDEVIAIAFSNGEVIRSLGGQVINNPLAAISDLDPEIQDTNPFFGSMAAASQFDPTFQLNATFQKNDDVFNNSLLGGGTNEVQQDLFNWNYSLSKFANNGTQFTISGLTQHDNNNAAQNLFDHSWTQAFEASIRKPLLQGAGVEFNQIAGPNSTIGLRGSNGILLAQVNTEISVLQFERNVRDFLRELISSYWQLHFAYKNHDAAVEAYEKARMTWQAVAQRLESDLVGGEADREALARVQMIRFETQKFVTMSGEGNGSPGIYEAEANLRRLMGITENDMNPNLIDPSDQPLEVDLNYDWQLLIESALSNRPEIMEQELRVQQREMELLVAKNFTLPRLDAVMLWRNNGFGDDRFGNGQIFGSADQRFSSSQEDFWSLDHQEWEFNLQFAVPLGRRLQFDALKNAELNLRKERSVLEEQHQAIRHSLAQAFRSLALAFQQKSQAEKQLKAADAALKAREELYRIDKITLDELITAQQNFADAEINLAQNLTAYENARMEIQVERGTFLSDYGISRR